MAKNRRAKRRYEPSVTPTHFLRIARVKARIDADLRWYAIPTYKDRELVRGLSEAGIAVYRDAEVELSRKRGSVKQIERRPMAGYVFAGFPEGVDGRLALWAVQDAAKQRTASDRLFSRIMGPFDAEELVRVICRLRGIPYAVLWDQNGPVDVFVARAAGIVEREHVGLAKPEAA